MAVAFGEFEFDPAIPELRRAGRRISLGEAPLRLLRALLERPGAPVSKDALMKAAWGRRVNAARLTSAIAELRQALEADQAEPSIATLSRVGYRFAADVAAARKPPPPVANIPPPYVGRTPLLDQLRAALTCADAGQGCMTVLVGEPGIGKTRLVEELSRELPKHVGSAWGYCREAGDTPPLWPWYELLAGLQSGAHDAASHERHSDLLTRAALGAETTRGEAFERAAATVVHASADTTWLLVLDDLHRVDAASLELLLRVADRIGETRIHLVTTLRAHQAPASGLHAVLLSRVLEHPSCKQLVVGPLSAEDVATYVAAQVADPDGELAKAVYEKSEGNPFFMTELVRQLASASDRDAPAALRLPLAALDLMRQRVQDIDEQTRGLLSVCAVIGRTISLDLLAEVLELPHDDVRLRLEEAVRRGVLVALDGLGMRFSHELIRSVVYDGIAPTQCRQWHARVALALEQRRRQGREIAASETAFHCHSALPLGDLHMAIRVCREAADEAAAAFGATDVAHYTHYALEALRLLPQPSVRLRMSLLYGVAIYSRPYDTAMYARCVQELIELAHQCKNGEMLTRASALMDAHPRLEPLARTSVDPALALDWLPTGAPGLHALALANQAVREPVRFDAALCLPLVRRAGALVDEAMATDDVPGRSSSPGHVIRANARGRHACYTALLHQLYLDAEDPLVTQRIYERLEELAQRSPFELSTLPVDLAWHRASQALAQGDHDAASRALRAGAAHARELTHAELLWHSERALALLRVEREGTREACDALQALHQRAATQALRGIDAFCAYDACVYFDLDPNQPERLAAMRAALLPSTHDTPALWAMKLRGLASAGILDEARSTLGRVPAQRLVMLPRDGDFIGTLGHVTHAAVALESTAHYPVLETLLNAHDASFSAQVLGGYAGWVSTLLGMLAYAAGRHQEAVERLEQASARRDQSRSPRGVEAQLWLVKSLLALGRPRGALMILGQAQADAQNLHHPGVKRLAQALRNEAQRLRG